ncbi:MAG TPA: CoA-binding protein [Candidatus Poseidoniaceae archaeon]|nr:MAG TPA: CoA-binding protein [Candidatus Poseidoniales archaeon]HIH53320.1 CoA-binding protein [Candidatus Poseidoniaceae archaeon]
MEADLSYVQTLEAASSIHVFGAGLNAERTSHTAVPELRNRGWRVVPVHPRDGGACIEGVPIRSSVEEGTPVEVAVLFLAPERARAQVRRLLLTQHQTPPLVWFQPGAEDDVALEWLSDAGWPHVHADCIVRYSERHDVEKTALLTPWYRQVADQDGSQCSVWTAHAPNEHAPPPSTVVEWVGDLIDLATSKASIPAYIRNLRNEGESLEDCALRLSK